MAVSQWTFSKGFGRNFSEPVTRPRPERGTADNTNPLGPCLVASSAIPDPQAIPLKTAVNGQVLQDGNTASVSLVLSYLALLGLTGPPCREQIFNVKQTVAWLAQGTTLEPGTIILTGTPKGVGFVRNPPIYLKHGDEVQVSLGSGIGTLVNPVVEENYGSKL